MPKMRSHSGAKKRFFAKKNGKIKRAQMGKAHILTKKTRKRKMALRKGEYVSKTQEKTIRTMIQG